LLAACALEQDGAVSGISPLPQDRRFAHPSWQSFPFNAAIIAYMEMIVIGAFVHSRFSQAILGGFTQTMLDEPPVPLFMAH
jgi:nucleotide-binding universal stress UspA family protein